MHGVVPWTTLEEAITVPENHRALSARQIDALRKVTDDRQVRRLLQDVALAREIGTRKSKALTKRYWCAGWQRAGGVDQPDDSALRICPTPFAQARPKLKVGAIASRSSEKPMPKPSNPSGGRGSAKKSLVTKSASAGAAKSVRLQTANVPDLQARKSPAPAKARD